MASARTRDVDRIRQVRREIRSVDEIGPYAKVCAYGVQGSQKTRLAASFPDVLIIDINEEGTRSAVGSGAKVIEAPNWEKIGDIYWYLAAGKHKFKSVALDTVTAMQSVAMDFVLAEKEDRDPSAEKKMPDKRSYGRAGKLMEGMLLAYRNLPMHVIFLAQERTVEDQDTGEIIEHTVDLPNSSRGAAMGSVGILGRMYTQEVKTRNKKTRKVERRWVPHMLLGPSDEFRCKDRTGQLGRIVRQPTGEKIITAWQTGMTLRDEEE